MQDRDFPDCDTTFIRGTFEWRSLETGQPGGGFAAFTSPCWTPNPGSSWGHGTVPCLGQCTAGSCKYRYWELKDVHTVHKWPPSLTACRPVALGNTASTLEHGAHPPSQHLWGWMGPLQHPADLTALSLRTLLSCSTQCKEDLDLKLLSCTAAAETQLGLTCSPRQEDVTAFLTTRDKAESRADSA